MSEFLIEFGKKLKGYRKLKNLSQEKLAELSNVSTNTISLIENGKTFIKYKNLCSICRVLDIKEIDLFNFSMSGTAKISTYSKIMEKAKKLSPKQQKQLLEIMKTFET